jgi:hypothetical protein
MPMRVMARAVAAVICMMADALLEKTYRAPRIDWAGDENLQNNSERRTKYINALRAADRGEFRMLFVFAGVNQMLGPRTLDS